MIKDPKTDPIPAPDPATPTVAAPAPINLAAESISRLAAEVVRARLAKGALNNGKSMLTLQNIKKYKLQNYLHGSYCWPVPHGNDGVLGGVDSDDTSKVGHFGIGFCGV